MAIATKTVERQEPPAISTVYLTDGGSLRHTRCGEPIAFLRRRQELELYFYCRVCHEHIALPEYALSRIPVGAPELASR
jgi:hypothetical protein